jgi:hypothetical protein
VESLSHIPSGKRGATVCFVTSEREEKPTVAMRKDELLGLVAQTRPEEDENVSPIAVIAVIAMFVGLFVAIVGVS